MSLSRESIAGFLSIVTLVATAVWYARHPEIPNCFHEAFDAAGESRLPLPEISVGNVEWSVDGRRLLVRSRIVGGRTDTLTLHSPTTDEGPILIDAMGHTKFIPALAPDGLAVLVATMGGELCRIDVESSETITLARLPDNQGFTRLAVTGDGRQCAAAGTSRGQVLICDLHDLTVSELKSGQSSSVCALRFSHDGERLASSHADGSIAIWNLVSGEREQVLAGNGGAVYDVAFLHDDTQIISGALDDSVRIWDIASGREERCGEFGLGGVRALDVAPNGRTAAWGGFCQRIVVWDLEHRCNKFEFTTAAGFVSALKFSPDGMTLAAAGFEGIVRIYDMRSGTELKSLGVAEGIDPNRPHSGD
jgi:WD40 repeat protein